MSVREVTYEELLAILRTPPKPQAGGPSGMAAFLLSD
jgi:hypothetical protein